MSDQVATAFSQKYNTGIQLLSQQLEMVTRGACREEKMSAKRDFFDQVGVVRMQQKTGRAQDLPSTNTPHARRSVTAKNYAVRDFIDEDDLLQILNDPTNAYTMTQAAAANREFDKVLIDAALGTAYVGEEGATPVVLPSSQKIAAGTSGFTLAKLKQAVRIIKSANALRQGEKLHVLWTAKQEEEFINSTEVKSFDYNNQKVLVDGVLTYFYGCFFHRIEDVEDNDGGRMLPKVSTTRSCILYAETGLLRAVRKPPRGRVSWLPEKETYQVSTSCSVGATRMEEKKVVQIDVVEST